MSIFDRIAAAIALILAGAKKDAEELRAHFDAIDDHLSSDDEHNTAVDANLTENDHVPDDEGHVDVIHAGLQKIIAATGAQTPEQADAVASTEPACDTDAGNTADTPAATPPDGGASDIAE